MSDRPTFDSLVGDDLPPDERARLERVHELLLAAGAPPELPPTLREAPESDDARVVGLPRRRLLTTVVTAVAAGLVLFGLGYAVGDSASPKQAEQTVAMRGTGEARARLAVFARDEAGNWPMELEVRGLEPLPKGVNYELWLTRDGELAEQCGSFAVAGGTTTVPLNAPYRLSRYTGWVVVRAGSTETVLSTDSV